MRMRNRRGQAQFPRVPSRSHLDGLLRIFLLALSVATLHGCSFRQASPDTHESLNAVLWTQTSVEYAASALQAYQLATANLDRALADPQWTAALEQGGAYSDLPPAVLLDLDQTVLNTSPYNARIILEYGSHSRQHFAAWCEGSAAKLIPGAKGFLEHAAARGVTVIYISARKEALRECTTSNLRALGLPLHDQRLLWLNDGTPETSKALQRARAAAQYRVLLLVGDDFNDFVGGSKVDPDRRRALFDEHVDRWGREWIVLPNAMYGSWAASLYGFDFSLTRDERLKRLLQQLEP